MAVRIVGIGASAGGLQALESFFSELPSDLGVAFVVVQHLSMNHASSMSTILQRSTQLPVLSLEKDTLPEPNHVYVKLPEYDVRLGQMLKLSPRISERNSLYLPIDDFFFSLATAQEERAIGIVLSGMGTDGSRGLKEIKGKGGLVMIQNPDSAQFNGMPNAALRQHIADVVLPPGGLASRLAMILRNDGQQVDQVEDLSSLTHRDLFRNLLDRIKSTTRIDFHRYRQATIRRRIEKRMLITQYADLAEYINFVLNNEEELQVLRQSFLIGVTRFFRDQDAFKVLRDQIIPRLFTDSPEHREIRIWIPSCSTGEEVYSVAMLMQDYLLENNVTRSYKIFGSDVDRKSIILASRGEYDDTIVADVPSEFLQRYFIRQPGGFKIRNELKENILFAVQNLLEDPPFIRIDLLSCRNFLIYINSDTQQRILANFHFSLNPAGYLLLGPSENLATLQSAFTTIDRRWKVYQKRAGGKTLGGKLVQPVIENVTPVAQRIAIVTEGNSTFPSPVTESSRPIFKHPSTSMDQFSRYLSERFAPATLFVNRQYDILYLNGDFEGILRLPRFNAHLSLRTVVNEEVEGLLIAGVDRVFSTGNSGLFERINVSESGQPARYHRVRFNLTEFASIEDPVAILEFSPVKENEADDSGEEGDNTEVYSVDRRLLDKTRELEIELQRSEKRGQKLYNELEATNEELQSSNRELLASNEEMQSTNEELQSVNEELYTVNNEFQRKNEELNDINNDVNNLLKSTQISTIFVDSRLRIRRFIPGMGQQFDLNSSDIGRPITTFAIPFDDLNIEAMCQEVLEGSICYDKEVQDRKGNIYLLRMLPYLTEEERVEGVVITFVDINDLVRTRRRLTELALKYEAIFNNTREVIAIVRESSKIDEINQPLAERNVEEIIGTYFTDLIATSEEKVRFSEVLRTSFDRREVGTITLSLHLEGDSEQRVEAEIIPITRSFEIKAATEAVDEAMIILHDITSVEQERELSTKIIRRYQSVLSKMQQGAGLIDMEERLVLVNHMNPLPSGPEHFLRRKLDEFLTDSGVARYRAALERIKNGDNMVEVVFKVEELKEDDLATHIVYRPVYSGDKLVFVSFEIMDN